MSLSSSSCVKVTFFLRISACFWSDFLFGFYCGCNCSANCNLDCVAFSVADSELVGLVFVAASSRVTLSMWETSCAVSVANLTLNMRPVGHTCRPAFPHHRHLFWGADCGIWWEAPL